MDILVFRDPHESARKCSLTPLRGLPGIRFEHDRPGLALDVGRRILLHPEGEELGPADRELADGLLLVDCSWRRLPSLVAKLSGTLMRRRLPPLVSAYPRRSKLGTDPERGLASVEALFAALSLLGEERPEILDGYRWREAFLAANRGRLGASMGPR